MSVHMQGSVLLCVDGRRTDPARARQRGSRWAAHDCMHDPADGLRNSLSSPFAPVWSLTHNPTISSLPTMESNLMEVHP
jgi:hypothetical protein